MSEGKAVCSVREGGWRRYRLRIPDLASQTFHWLSPRNTLHHARPDRHVKAGEYVLIHPDGRVMEATEQNAQIIEDWYTRGTK